MRNPGGPLTPKKMLRIVKFMRIGDVIDVFPVT